MAVIAFDLGGTKLAGAIFGEQGRPVGKRAASLAGQGGREVGELFRVQLQELLDLARARRLKVRAIGVSVPGISQSRTGRVWAPNIPGWEDYPLRQELARAARRHLGPLPVLIDSDRACSILGERWRGAARGRRNALFLAVGTGIGLGILVEGEVLRGAHDIAGAIGWWALERPFRSQYAPCGCFEHHGSGEGLAKVAREFLARRPRGAKAARFPKAGRLTAYELFSAYEHGEALAKEVLGQAIEFWGMAVANLVSLFNPETIIFGGGVFGPAIRFLEDIYAEARKWAQPVAIEQVKLQASKLGSDAALYGAASLALRAR